MTQIYKYLPPARIDVLENLSIRFTQPSALNDPFEVLVNFSSLMTPDFYDSFFNQMFNFEIVNAEFRDEIEKVIDAQLSFLPVLEKDQLRSFFANGEIKVMLNALLHPIAKPIITQKQSGLSESFKSSFDKIFGVLSLTRRNDNLTMWSHYTDNHQGFVLEFNPNSKMLNNQRSKIKIFQTPQKVSYTNKRPELAILDSFKGNSKQIYSTVKKILFTKSSDWRYEEERRMLVTFNPPNDDLVEAKHEIYLHRFDSTSLLNIYMGINMSLDCKNRLCEIMTDSRFSHINLFQATLNKSEYKLEFESVQF